MTPSFFSYCYPFSRVFRGIPRQEVINVSNTTANRFQFLLGDQSDVRTGDGEIDLGLVNWSASVAVRAHDRLRLGLTLSHGWMDRQSSIVNSYVDPGGTLIGDTNLAGVPLEMYRTSADGSDTDVIGIGASWRPLDALNVALDSVTIRYNDPMQGFNSRLNVLTAGFPTDDDARFTMDDRTNLHLGVEHILPARQRATRIILRGGYLRDKDNRLRSDFQAGGFGLGSSDNFPGRPDTDHYSDGVGIVAGNTFQLDTAVDLASTGAEGVVSMIYKFQEIATVRLPRSARFATVAVLAFCLASSE